jgi:hypothetical protein
MLASQLYFDTVDVSLIVEQNTRMVRAAMRRLVADGVRHCTAPVHLDTWPVVRSICASEAARRESKVSRRFLHYLSRVAGLNEALLAVLGDGPGTDHTRVRLLQRKTTSRPHYPCACERYTPEVILA